MGGKGRGGEEGQGRGGEEGGGKGEGKERGRERGKGWGTRTPAPLQKVWLRSSIYHAKLY